MEFDSTMVSASSTLAVGDSSQHKIEGTVYKSVGELVMRHRFLSCVVGY